MSRHSLRPSLRHYAHSIAPVAVAPAVPWYLAGDIAPENCVAAYQAVGAESQAASYVNLANPGTHNLTATGAIAWGADTGWDWTGTGQYLTSTVSSALKPVTVLVRCTPAATNSMPLWAGAASSGTFEFRLNQADLQLLSQNVALIGASAGDYVVANTDAVYGVSYAGNGAYGLYVNGVLVASGTNDKTLTSGNTRIGYEAAGSVTYDGTIASVAVYNRVLTGDEVAAVSQAMSDAAYGSLYIQFDDNAAGVYTLAYPYMDAAGIKGTIYAVSDWIGQAGRMTSAQLQEVYAAGWDIGNHTKSHPGGGAPLASLSLADQTTQLSDCKNALDALDLTRASAHVAYPQGSYDADTLTAMANSSMVTGRQALGMVTFPGVSVPVANAYEIPGYELGQGANMVAFKTVILLGLATGNHVLIYTHNVVESGGAAYDALYSQFTDFIDWVVANNIPCKTITELPLA